MTTTHIYISSQDRESGSASNFRVNLSNSPVAKCNISLVHAQIPNTYYNIDSTNNAIQFGVSLYTINPGIYTLQDLLTAVANLTEDFTLSFNDITQRITITNTVGNFDLNLNIDNSIYKKLGFAKANFTGSASYTGTAIPKIYESSLFICINGIPSNCITSRKDFIKNSTFIIPNNVNKNEICSFYAHSQFYLKPKYSGPLNHLDVRVLNDDGYEVQNLAEWSMVIEVN